jgi:hypothetical protein
VGRRKWRGFIKTFIWRRVNEKFSSARRGIIWRAALRVE